VLFFKSNIYLVLDDCVPFRVPGNISKAADSKQCCVDTDCTCALKKDHRWLLILCDFFVCVCVCYNI